MSAAAIISKTAGAAFVVRDGQETVLTAGMELFVSDSVRTGMNGQLEIRFADGTEVSLSEMSQVQLSDFHYDPSAPADNSFAMHMMEGLVRTVSGEVVKLNPEGFTLSTPLGTAGIRGTTVLTQIFPTHVVFMVTELGAGHAVVVNNVFGGELTIYQPGKGAEISVTGQEKIQLIESLPPEMRDMLNSLLSGEFDAEGRSSHDDFILLQGDADSLAALGAADVGRGVGMLSEEQAEVVVSLLEELGVEQPEFFLEAEFSDDEERPAIITWDGTPLNDMFIGAPDHSYALSSAKGNDLLVVFNGNDTVYGGNGSADKIIKVADLIASGTFLYGGEASLSNVTLDSDTITLRSNAVGDLADYAPSYTDGNGVTSQGTVMTGGEVYGSAGVAHGVTNADGGNVITLYGQLAGGSLYGTAAELENSNLGAGASANTILVAAANGVSHGITSGAIYGDGHSLGNSTAGADIITVETGGVMSGGVIYGDGYSLTGSRGGNDSISLDRFEGGAIYGDAHSLVGSKAGNDRIVLDTLDNSGAIYGDAYSVSADSTLGADNISVSTMTGGTIYTDAEVGSATVSGVNTVSITTMLSGTIYGGSGADFVTVSNFSGGAFDLGGGADTLSLSNWAVGSLDIGEVKGGITLIGTDSNASTIQIDRLTSGSNFVLGGSLTNKAVHVTEHQGGAIDIGSGTGNTLSFDSITGNSSVTAAHFDVGTISGQLSAQRAAGTSIAVKNAMTAADASVTTGTGNDRLDFEAAVSGASVSAGGGQRFAAFLCRCRKLAY